MYFGCHAHTFIISVALQGCVNLGITKTPVHLGAVETVAVLCEYNALHLVCLTLVFESDFLGLPLQIGYKHVPVTAPAYLFFENVV